MQKIKKGDEIIVRCGKDKGKTGTVLRLVKDDRVEVEGINLVKKHVKPNPNAGVEGGIENKTMPLHVSNVALVNPETGRADRVGLRVLEDNTKVRFFKSNGEVVNN